MRGATYSKWPIAYPYGGVCDGLRTIDATNAATRYGISYRFRQTVSNRVTGSVQALFWIGASAEQNGFRVDFAYYSVGFTYYSIETISYRACCTAKKYCNGVHFLTYLLDFCHIWLTEIDVRWGSRATTFGRG
jgi:hypothetical protein